MSLQGRGDMTEVYKLLTGKVGRKRHEKFFNIAESHYSFRGHDKKLVKERSRLDTNLSQRVIIAASLSMEVVNMKSVNGFKMPTIGYTTRIWTT